MKKLISLLILLLLVAGAVWVVYRNKTAAKAAVARAEKARTAPVPVVLATVATRDVPVELSTFGAVEPTTTVAVKSRITGILAKVLFAEGQDVAAGDPLFEIDPREAAAALRQAEAALARDRVQLTNALNEAARQETLLKKGIAAQDVRDAAVTAAGMLKASVEAGEAAVEQARLQLSYCSIDSPVSGRAGSLLIHPGNLVKANEGTLVVVNQLRPILVRFVLPQQELPRIRSRLAQGALPVIATVQGDGMRTETGTVAFVDNAVDEKTGTIQLKATFRNAGNILWPGQFVKVVLTLSTQKDAIVVPESAMLLGQQGAYVYGVDAAGKASVRPVKLDRTVAGQSVVAGGLVPGEVVVVDGQLRLKPGSLVKSRQASAAGHP